MGKHCYCEKPLTHNVREARLMREIAAEKKLATQMGNQGTSTGDLRQGVEIIQSGAIGEVREVHIWTNRPIWPQGFDALLVQHQGVKNALSGSMKGGHTIAPPPDTLAWDLWLGPAAERPYDAVYCPFKWRGWWDFGTGALGDMACHTMNLPYWALKLGAPTSVEAKVWELNPQTAPRSTIISYQFPARGDLPPVTVTWYDGKMYPPKDLFHGEKISGSGSLMVGTKGKYYSSDDYGERRVLLPRDAFKDYQPPAPSIPRSPGHHREWIEACKGGKPAFSNFDYSGPLTEMVLLGVVATRANGRIEWDPTGMNVTNDADANRLLTREYRKGWEI